MGSTILHKLLWNQSHSTAARIIPLIHKSILQSAPAAAAAGRATSPSSTHSPVSPTTSLQIPLPLSAQPGNGDPTPCSRHFPSFSVGFFLNPNPSTSVAIPDVDGGVSGDSPPAIWADSVKKKRKRKMNKHKLRKMRKAERKKN